MFFRFKRVQALNNWHFHLIFPTFQIKGLFTDFEQCFFPFFWITSFAQGVNFGATFLKSLREASHLSFYVWFRGSPLCRPEETIWKWAPASWETGAGKLSVLDICLAQPVNVPGSSQMCFRKKSSLDLGLQVTGICHFPPSTADCFPKSCLFWGKFILNGLPWVLFYLIWGFQVLWWFCQQRFHTLRSSSSFSASPVVRTFWICEDLGIN